ncbi:MAG: hypothetical protein KJ623_03380 [Nanoarchaeota archaeon]|nr:hypothetical protein [Nanoarchaeota archaeon]MBU0962797.1 hypothetical protein [Nanoarchaeota archaeon]
MDYRVYIHNKMKRILPIIMIFSIILLVSGCDLEKIGKTCSQECVQQENQCVSYSQVCVDKNWLGNCVQFEDRCNQYQQKCVRYDEVCR